VPTRDLPSDPDLEHLRGQAKSLLKAAREARADALATVREFLPAPPPVLRHTDALLVIARQYGFASWPKLKAHVQLLHRFTGEPHRADPTTAPDRFLAHACLAYGGDDPARIERARELLSPELIRGNVHVAAAAGDAAAVAALLADDRSLAGTRGGPHRWEPLLYLAYSRVGTGDALVVARLLLDAGADPNAGYLWEGSYAFTALTGVLGEGEDAPNQPRHPQWEALARLLLDRGADANDSQGLYNRMFGRTDDHLRLLFEYGLGAGDGGPWYHRFPKVLPSPAQMVEDQLLWAAEHGLAARAELLLAHGCNPDGLGFWFTDRPGGTALRRALDSGSDQVVALLRAAGAADVMVTPEAALLAEALAGRTPTADPATLAAARKLQPDAIRRAVELRRPNAIRVLTTLGFDLDAGPRTALHEAAYNGQLEITQLLVSLGADPFRRDTEYDGTALNWAEHAHQDEVADYLRSLDGDKASG
jgi:hypothetical protein